MTASGARNVGFAGCDLDRTEVVNGFLECVCSGHAIIAVSGPRRPRPRENVISVNAKRRERSLENPDEDHDPRDRPNDSRCERRYARDILENPDDDRRDDANDH
jgi:hypothetical protein